MQNLKLVHDNPHRWRRSVIFFDEYHDQIIEITGSADCFEYLKSRWHLHGADEAYFAAQNATVRVLRGDVEHCVARELFIKALRAADAQIVYK